MTKRLTIQDIARLAGVSHSTVSRVLNKKPDVDAATRERVLRVVEEHSFVPSQAATRLAGGRSQILGVLVPPLSWPFIEGITQGAIGASLQWPLVPEIMRGVTEYISTTPYELLLYSISQHKDHHEIIQRILATQLISGLLAILPADAADQLEAVHEHGLPVVLIDDQGAHPNIPWVGTDNRYGAYLAVKHLLGLGHRRIGHIRGLYACSEERYQGYCDALREAGIAPDPALVLQGDFAPASGQACARAFFAMPERPTALFVGNDQMAYGVLAVAQQLGVRIPDEVAVVGFDDIPLSAYIRPALTTVHQPFFEMGQRAARLLLSLVESAPSLALAAQESLLKEANAPDAALHIQLATSLTVRESCGARAAHHFSLPMPEIH
ncbi:MAG TPA: LacI family DNA-binding transcriptional regulator [Ktedonobacterales bacterium]|nr:LacI family DNA-binding transcriptional regulator [Ktedonobacterales bacterium]